MQCHASALPLHVTCLRTLPCRSTSPNAGAASCHVVAYDVAGGQPAAWAQAHGQELGERLAACPGPAVGLACSPTSPSRFLLHSPAAVSAWAGEGMCEYVCVWWGEGGMGVLLWWWGPCLKAGCRANPNWLGANQRPLFAPAFCICERHAVHSAGRQGPCAVMISANLF